MSLATELRDDAVRFIGEHVDKIAQQAAGICPTDPKDAARFALQDLLGEASDYLVDRFTATLATYGIPAGGEVPYRPMTAEEALRHSFRTGERPCGKCGGKGWVK